ncbi:hypothetical protein CTAYLR_008442 [Chrysophaeum taylorii]|uniref:ATP synthase subunit d, mitochondrial n=1 Tax=Chrysophaeum taylorii TaxID=2483200 RepID=A0AAD7ULJ2_9STRA|nr:hypothetical protein CTAYLR_008442 [Chrysophaeum taylorii]
MTIRRGARRLSSLAKLGELVVTDDAKQEVGRLRALLGEVTKLKTKYSSDPAPIDFGYYKTKLDPALVESIEANYASIVFPDTVEPTDAAAIASARQSKLSGFMTEADALIDESQERIKELKATIDTMQAKMTGPDTCVTDVYEQYPDIEAEVDDEIKNHQWSKDVL